jgi:molybdopterin synthase catalytic subunit
MSFPRIIISEKIPMPEEVIREYKEPSVGAIVVFEGRPRNDNGISALFYESYDEMAINELEEIRKEALNSFEVQEIFIFHRKGLVKVGEVSFIVIVCAKHRQPAFRCVEWIVDKVKERVPIWKKDVKF